MKSLTGKNNNLISALMAKSIYELELHEVTKVAQNHEYETSCMRVPGGWIYTDVYLVEPDEPNQEALGRMSQVFVPLNNEFNPSNKSFDYEDFE